MDFTTRFAPSPTGHLHLGHAFSALTAFDAARAAGGRFILRLEDIDTTRCRPEYEDAIYEDLAWLGLEWERPVRRQSEHFAAYQAALEALIGRGLVYRCFKTRKEIMEEMSRAPHGPGEVYLGPETPMSAEEEAERLERGEPFAWRLSVAACRDALGEAFARLSYVEESAEAPGGAGVKPADPFVTGDVVLGRKDVGTAYHLAVVHDDALQGVTHVIRGVDLVEATHVQTLLYALFDRPQPVYRHHRLLTDENGRRFAKRDKSLTLRALREAGETSSTIRGMCGLS